MPSKMLSLAAVLLTPVAPLFAQGGTVQDAVQTVSPALGRYTEQTLLGDVWNRPGLSKRDRSVVTLAAPVLADTMEISPNGTRNTAMGPPSNFTGTVMIDSYFGANEHRPQTGGLVTFLPGARSAWHTHPAGQTLIVTSGTGWVNQEGGRKKEIRPGDVIWCPPGVKHWHGASSSTSMSHIALSNVRDDKNVVSLEKVSEEQYNTP